MKKSTLATWCREVELTEEQYTAIRQRTGSRESIPRDTNRKRRAEIYRLKFDARSHVPGLVSDPIWAAGGSTAWLNVWVFPTAGINVACGPLAQLARAPGS